MSEQHEHFKTTEIPQQPPIQDVVSESPHDESNSEADGRNELTRRDLLRVAGTGVLAAGAAKVAFAQPIGAEPIKASAQPFPKVADPLPRPNDERVGFAIVGIGKFALNQIIPSFAESKKSKLVALVSGDRAKALRVAHDYGVPERGVYSYDNFDQIKNNPDVKVVYVITPNALHRTFVERAARAGKHVLCEKPLATNSADGRAMIAVCKNAGVKLMVAYRAQYEPYNLEAIRLCRSGAFGKMISIVADHGRSIDLNDSADRWRLDKQMAGGGPLPDVGIYSLNACRYLTGEEPSEVQAMMVQPTGNPKFREVEQSLVWTMKFPSGVMTTCTTSYDYQETKRFRVLFQNAWLELDPATDYYKHNLEIERKVGPIGSKPEDVVEYKSITEMRPLAEKNQFALMMDHMSECVQQNKTPKTPGEEGLRDIRLIEAIYAAAKSGKVQKV